MEPIYLPLLWIVNGFLAALYSLLSQAVLVLTLLGLGTFAWFSQTSERSPQQPWIWGALGLAGMAAVMAPTPVPFMLLAMSWCALAALRLEQFNPDQLRWRISQGLALYGLIGLGVQVLTWYLASPSFSSAAVGLLTQGQSYLLLIASIALWGYPLMFLALLAQALWAHPPIGKPEELVTTVRTRGKESQ